MTEAKKNGTGAGLSGFLRILATLAIATACAFLIYAGIITFFVNPYIADHTWSQVSRDLDIYGNTTGSGERVIYFIGNSQVIHDLDPRVVEAVLSDANLSFRVYKLGVDDDTPLQRLIELQAIRESKPAMVLMGYSYTSFSNLTRYVPDDNLALLSGRFTLDPVSRSLYTRDQLALIDGNGFDRLIFKRKFIVPSIRRLFGIHLSERDTIVNDTMPAEQKRILAQNPYDAFLAPVYAGDNAQKQAFVHFTRELEADGIPVVFVNMPLDPLRSATIPDSTRENFGEFMNGTGVRSVNMEQAYSSDDFQDLVHMNRYGREKFSRAIGSLILEEASAGAL